METLTANEARIGFGDALQKAQRGPVQITKSGKPFAVLMSIDDYRAAEDIKMQALKERITRAEKDLAEGNFADGEDFMQKLTDRSRAAVKVKKAPWGVEAPASNADDRYR